jgi:hypothetical protein
LYIQSLFEPFIIGKRTDSIFIRKIHRLMFV